MLLEVPLVVLRCCAVGPRPRCDWGLGPRGGDEFISYNPRNPWIFGYFLGGMEYYLVIWGFPKMVLPNNYWYTIGFPTKNDQHLGCEMGGNPPF